MDIFEFKEKLNDYLIFDQNQIKLVFPKFDIHRLKSWQKKNYIEKLCKGFYFFKSLEISETVKYHFANRIYEPSYVSLESVLSLHGLIPETVFSITSVSTKKTRTIYTDHGNFLYKKIREDLFFGYQVEKLHGVKYKIARVEKAVLDYFYLNPQLDNAEKLLETRFDLELLFQIVDHNLFEKYLKKFENKALAQRIQIFKRSLNA